MRMQKHDMVNVGKEPPAWEGEPTLAVLVRYFNWYHTFFGVEDARKELITYAQQQQDNELAEAFADCPIKDIVATFAWIAKGIGENRSFGDYTVGKLQEYGNKIRLEHRVRSAANDDQTPSVRAKTMREVAGNIIADIEEKVDEIISSGKTEFSFSSYVIQHEVKPIYINYVLEYYLPFLEEAKQNKNKTLTAFFTSIINDCHTLKETNKKPRTPRKRKVNKDKLISKVQYKSNDVDLGVSGLEPIHVLNKDVLFCFDTIKRKLSVYYAGTNGFSFKGTTLVNIDEARSFEKTLRKPKEQLTDLINMNSKAKKLGYINALTTKPQKTSPRLNKNTIILKVY